MLFVEQAPAFAEQPDDAAFGSQSWASLPVQTTLHVAATPVELRETQQTVPAAQFAAPLHYSDTPAPPPFMLGHAAPVTH